MRKTLALIVVAVACAVPALALAAHPAKNSHFAWCPKKNVCPLDFNTSKTGKKIVHLSLFPKCAPVPPKTQWFPNMRVTSEGEFAKKGTVTDVLGHTVHFQIEGKFTRPKKAAGHFHVTQKGCKDSRHKFVAKRDGKAR
jgi:hypothetical protein